MMDNQDHNARIISVFGSHKPLPGSHDYELAKEMGRRLAMAGYTVSTGGYEGTMAAVSQGAAEAGGHVIGVTSTQVESTRSANVNDWVIEEVRYDSLLGRLIHLVKQNTGMIVLPGGVGTLSELALAWNLMQVEEIPPRPLVSIGSMWTKIIESLARSDFVSKLHLDLIQHAEGPANAIRLLDNFSNSFENRVG